jgi:hypothetical protein
MALSCRTRGKDRDEAEFDDLAKTRHVMLSLRVDEPAGDGPTNLHDNPVYRRVLTGLAAVGRPVRARDLCVALDLGLEPNKIRGMRALLDRLVARGLISEVELGLYALHQQQSMGGK